MPLTKTGTEQKPGPQSGTFFLGHFGPNFWAVSEPMRLFQTILRTFQSELQVWYVIVEDHRAGYSG